MRTIRTKVYLFSELGEEAQNKAISSNSDINVNYNWWFQTYEDAKNIGLKITSFDLDRNKHATGEFLQNAYDCANKIIKEHGENCDTYSIATNFLAGIIKEDDDFLNQILGTYANFLQGECDYLQSDEAIKQTIISNEYEFTKDGNLFNS